MNVQNLQKCVHKWDIDPEEIEKFLAVFKLIYTYLLEWLASQESIEDWEKKLDIWILSWISDMARC